MRWVAIIASTVCVGLLCIAPAKLVRDPPIVRVTAALITEGRLRGPIVHSGAVRAARLTTVGPTVPVIVRAIEVTPHSFVRAGAPLALLDTTGPQEPLDVANAALARTESELEARDVERQALERRCAEEEMLAAEGYVAAAEVEAARVALWNAQRRLENIQNRVAAAKAGAAEAAAAADHDVLRAPFDGYITAITPAGPFFELAADASPVEVVAEVGSREASGLRAGDTATLTSGGRLLHGHVDRFEQDADGSIEVVVQVAAQVRDLLPGTPMQVAFNESQRPVVVRVPTAALSFSPSPEILEAAGETNVPRVPLQPPASGSTRVWVHDGSEFVAVEIRVGEHDGEYAELVDGPLRPGDRVVTRASVPGD